MKIFILLQVAIFLSLASSFAQRTVLTFQYKEARNSSPQIDYTDLILSEGQQIQVTWLAGTSGTMKALLGEFASNNFPPLATLAVIKNYTSVGSTNGYFVGQAKGPCKVRITPSMGTIDDWVSTQYLPVGWKQQEGICEYEITTVLSGAPSAHVIPSASIVVPANAAGDVDVLLEQSTDMITWTQCLPGTYNASTQKRFFRVRAMEK